MFSFAQHFVSDNVMSWKMAYEACPGLRDPGNGTINMVSYLTSSPQQMQVLRALNVEDSVWLDAYRFHLGCKGNRCEFLTVEHKITNKKLKSICKTDDGLAAKFNCRGNETFNLTSTVQLTKLLRIPEYVQGFELNINQASISGIFTQCRMATKVPLGIKIGYGRCDQKLKVLCEKHLTASPVVTTLVFENRSQIADSEGTLIFNDDPNAAQPLLNANCWDTKWLITTSLTGGTFVLSFVICIRLCLRKKASLDRPVRRPSSFFSLRSRPFDENYINTS
ncbi:uncharacterized protein LOC111137870 isoform X2 [Crassostrea virginica]